MPRKIVPVPGVLPHEWHKHQPPSPEDQKEQKKQENMTAHERSMVTKPEIISPKAPELPVKPKTRVSLKQWQTVDSDPARMRRLMPNGVADMQRAAPRVGDAAEFGGRLLYPHEAVREIIQSTPGPQPARPARQDPKPEPSKAYHQAEKRSEPAVERHQPTTGVNAWREYAKNAASASAANTGPWKLDKQPQMERQTTGVHSQPVANAPSRIVQPVANAPSRIDHDQVDIKSEPSQSDNGSEPVAPARMRSPDLTDMKIPRPNQNYVASVRSAVSVLSLDESDNARGDKDPEQVIAKHRDIRNAIGVENNLHMSGGKLINKDIWAGTARQTGEIFLNPVYANPWIEDFVENQVDCDVRATFLYEMESIKHCHSDVDTFSGKLLSPIQYDYTAPDYMNSQSLDRQMTRTASLYVQRKAIKAASKNQNGPPRAPPGWVDTPLTTTTELTSQKQGQLGDPSGAKSVASEDRFSPRVPCHMRPAQKEDMEGVRAIYNWEVLHGIQALDTEPLSLADWEGILTKTQDSELPFVVVLRGLYQYQAAPSSREETEPTRQEVVGKVLAFGFLTVRQPGLAGSFNGTSRMSAKAHVFVHPEYRRKKLGHVCLDKLLSTVSTRYSTKLGYEFINFNDNHIYKYPWHHERKTYSVFIEYLVPRTRENPNAKFAPKERDLEWFEKVMTSRYGFWKVARLEAAHRSRRSYKPAPVWLDTVMFEHICQEGLGFTDVL